MNKILSISAVALLGLGVAFSSCSREEDDIFDHSAAQRLDEAKTSFKQILTDKGGKWQLEYFTTDSEEGFVYLFTFNANGSVTISGDNRFIAYLSNPDATGTAYGSETSLWDVIGDNGPVLTLNSYNKYFHLFANPEDVPGTAANEAGYGHKGDYEFDLMKYSNDTLYLEGKKYEQKMIMTRIDQNTDDKKYLGEVVALTDSFFNAKIPTVYLNLPDGKRYTVKNGASLLLDFCPEDGDPITQTVTRNAIITHNGLTLMNAFGAEDSTFMVQHFVRQADGSLLCTDDGKTTITADNLNKVVTDKSLTWTIDMTAFGGAFKTAYDQMVTDLDKYSRRYRVQSMEFSYVGDNKYKLNIAVRPRTGSQRIPLEFTYTVAYDGVAGLKYNFDTPTAGSSLYAFYNGVGGLKQFVELLGSTNLVGESSSVLAPVKVKLADKANDANYVTINVK